VLKGVLLRYGGANGLRKSVPLFLGVAFGDIVMMVFWLIVASLTGKHRVFLLPG
jgi:threonine/homoserine/homoserine lactone efflux protein